MNTNSTKSLTLDTTTTSSDIGLSGKAIHPNTTKSGIQQTTSTMQNTQSNHSTGATQESPEWIHLTINGSSSAPHPIVKQERRSQTPESSAQHVARNATRTSTEYSGLLIREVAHASMNWTDALTMDAKSISAKNKGQAGTHNSPGDRENQVSPTTTTGDRRWERTQERPGPPNNLVSEGPEEPTETL